jgi:transcriptional regulator with XRE-family HTH domain
LAYPFQALGTHIARGREAAGLSRDALADRVGLSGVAVARFEEGIWRPTPPVLRRITTALGASFADVATLARYTVRERCHVCRA